MGKEIFFDHLYPDDSPIAGMVFPSTTIEYRADPDRYADRQQEYPEVPW